MGHKVAIAIPTLNEADKIGWVVDRALQLTPHVYVIDGNSTDDTQRIAREHGAEILLQSGNGKGSALREWLPQLSEDIIVYLDGDGTYDPLDAPSLVDRLLNSNANLVLGSRLKFNQPGSIRPLNWFGNVIFSLAVSILGRVRFLDTQTGFRAIRRDDARLLFRHLTATGFAIETQMLVRAIQLGFKIEQVNIHYYRRGEDASKLHPFSAGKEIIKIIFTSFFNPPPF